MSLYKRLDNYLQAHAETARPLKGDLSAPNVVMIWLAANLVVTTLLTGTLFVPGVHFLTALAMIVMGTAVGNVVLTLVGSMGARTGLPTMALTRGSFGINGSLLPLVLNVIVLMGWAWVQAMLAGVTVNALVENLTGFSNPILFSILCQSIVVTIAIFGHEGIAKLEPWFAVLLLMVISWIFYTAFSTFGFSAFQHVQTDSSSGFTSITVLDIVIATAISWTVLSADINRLARSTRAGIIGSGVGYTLSTITSMSLGLTAFVYIILRSGSVPEVFNPTIFVQHFGAPIAVVIFFSVMATNTMVVYGMVTSVINARVNSRLHFLPTALIIGGASILGASWLALLNLFTDFLVMIGAFFIPVFAIMIVDYYIIKKRTYDLDMLAAKGGSYWYNRGINWAAIGVWIVGAAMSYIWSYVWPLSIGATVPAFILSFILYLAVMFSSRPTHEVQPSRHLSDLLAEGVTKK